MNVPLYGNFEFLPTWIWLLSLWNITLVTTQNMGSWNLGSWGRFCQVRKVLPKNNALCREFPNNQKKSSLIAIMYASDDSILFKAFLTRFFFFLFTSISGNLLRYIAYSFDIFWSLNLAKVRKVGISEIWVQRELTYFVDQAWITWYVRAGDWFLLEKAEKMRNKIHIWTNHHWSIIKLF